MDSFHPDRAFAIATRGDSTPASIHRMGGKELVGPAARTRTSGIVSQIDTADQKKGFIKAGVYSRPGRATR